MSTIPVNNKTVEYQIQIDNPKIITFFLGFKTAFGVNSWNDIVLDSFYSALHSSGVEDSNILVLDFNTIEIIVTNSEITFQKLNKWGFNLSKKISEASFIKKDVVKKLSVKSIQSLFENGCLFKDSDCLLESKGHTSISLILDKTVQQIEYPHRISAIPFYSFISLIEWENNILAKLSNSYSPEQKISYYKTFRLYELSVYYEAYLAKGEIKDWVLIELNRLYNMLYKFGSKEEPKFFNYAYYSVFKPYRSDVVYVVNRKWLNKQKSSRILDKEIIIPNITLVSK